MYINSMNYEIYFQEIIHQAGRLTRQVSIISSNISMFMTYEYCQASPACPRALEHLIIKYVIHGRDEKKLSRTSVEAE